MAKKIRKRRPSLMWLLGRLAIPWIVMGAVVFAVLAAGHSDLAAWGAGLAGALAVTFLIRFMDDRKKSRRVP